MKPEHKAPLATPKQQKDAAQRPFAFYAATQNSPVCAGTELASSQFVQPWTAFSTLEVPATQKIIMYYKTTPCGDPACSRGKLCMHYHSLSDRRRPPFYNCRLVYTHSMCPYITQGLQCGKGDQCEYAHTNEESLYHPAKYKTSLCLQGPICAHDVCPWAHLPEELRTAATTQAYSAFDQPAPPPQYPPFVQAYAIPADTVAFAASPSYPPSVPALDAELATFKTEPCSYQYQHNHKHCVFYHSSKDRRRVPGRYSAERCEASETDSCVLGDSCPKSHSMVERLYHPDKYKTKYCNNYPDRLQECEYGSYCCFAHSDSELKVELIHHLEMDEDFFLYYFKTGWCPFNHEHNKAACVYAHNWQDFRRKPHLFHYSNELCPNWQSETFISEYKEGCIYEHNCGYCHGWKEQLYHPLTYKTIPCPDVKKCQKGLDCPYFHHEYDHRYPNKFSVFLPRPRKYRQNSNLTLTNNVNIQKEYELQQIASRSLQTSMPITFLAPHSMVEMGRRYSEETPTQFRPSPSTNPSPPPKDLPKHRSGYDVSQPLVEKKPVQTQKVSAPLIHIREESPESQREDDGLFEIFEPTEDNKSASTLFFSPKLRKATPATGDCTANTMCEPAATPESETTTAGHKSCPVTPLPKRRSFVKSPVFERLHLNETDPAMDSDRSRERKKVERFLASAGLAKLYPVFAARELTMNDILIMSVEQLKEAGVEEESEARTIMDKVKENLEHHFEEELDSPGYIRIITNVRVGREEPVCETDETEKEGSMKIFSYLDKK